MSVTVSPEEFSDTWEKRPKSPVVIGLKALSPNDESVARVDASRIMQDRCSNSSDEQLWIDEYNAAFAAAVIGNAICDANNTTQWPKELPFPQQTITEALIVPAIHRLFNEYSSKLTALSPATPVVTNEEIDELLEELDELDELEPEKAAKVRRLIYRAYEVATE
jgi:hypothetical protein